MENLLFSINSTVPVFAVMVLGYILCRTSVIGDEYVRDTNRLTFRILLPVMLFNSMRSSDFQGVVQPGFLLFCLVYLLIYTLAAWLIASRFIKDRKKLGSFVQGVFRGNSAIIGVSVAQNIYENDLGPIPLMLSVAMIFFNAVSILILTCSGSAERNLRRQLADVFKSIVGNQIIWGILLGLACSLAQVRFPVVIDKILTNIGGMASVVALIAAGGGFSMESFRSDLKLIITAVACKLIIMPSAALLLGYMIGYRGVTLFSLLVMTGVSTATTSVVMARELKCDENLSINILAATTLCVPVTYTMWVYILAFMQLL